MKLNKKLEIEILNFHDSYWDYYLKGNVEGMIQMLDETYSQVGSAEMEVFSNKPDAVKFLHDTIDQVAGNLEMKNRITKIESQGELFLAHELCDVYVKTDEKWVFYSKFRATSLIQHKTGGWKFIHQHSSFPDSRTGEGENVAIDKIALENEQLREAIKRRTIELEHQNRELEIEAAVEKVRSESMAMQTTDDFTRVNKELLQQLNKLNIAGLTGVSFYLVDENETVTVRDLSSPGNMGDPNNYVFKFDSKKYPTLGKFVGIWKAADLDYFILDFPKDKLLQAVEELQHLQPDVAQQFKNAIDSGILNHQWNPVGRLSNGILSIDLMQPPTADTKTIVLKMAGAFNMAYQRFLDLQKAEAQARESKIQLALERVRARTMAMQKSDELPEAATLLFQQVQSLGMPAWSAGYCTWNDDEKKAITLWMSSEGVLQPPFSAPTTEDELFIEMRKGNSAGKTFHVVEMGGKKLEKHYEYMRKLPVVGEILDSILEAGHPLPTFQIMHHAYFSKGFLLFITYEHVPDAHDIFQRFGKVFDQTYTRFLDLQKAEAQAREAQIEAALERVRSRTMAMQHSNELSETAQLLFQQIKSLGVPPWSCGFNIWEKGDTVFTSYMGSPDSVILEGFKIPLMEEATFIHFHESRERGDALFIDVLEGEVLEEHYRYFLSLPEIKKAFEKRAQAGEHRPTFQINHLANFSHGNLMFITYEPCPEAHDIFIRFAKVFEQTYTRFLDLQKAEAQARESKIEAALEKVRSRSLAMQKPGELTEVAELLRKEMGQLGVEELETSSIYIVDKEKTQAECWFAIKDIREENKELVSDEMTITFAETWVGTEMEKFYQAKKEHSSIVMKGDNRKEWINYCAGKSNVLQGYYGDEIPERTYHLVKFNGGYLGAASPGDISEESWDLLRRTVSVFSLAYTRFSDLQIAEANARQAEQDLIAIKEAKQKAEEALTELQATQKQLIQAEKMASLGKLTAGIAHEIQNPLNFVNNFSEVSNELISELKLESLKVESERDKGLEDELLNDIAQNLEKIYHHGKRASDIVKGMLEHSRTRPGQKEPTDINALCDEYLRLAYHGLKAKDNSFNATMETHFDPNLPKIEIIPQDIGRVILNLITNAFYAVTERGQSNANEKANLLNLARQKGAANLKDFIYEPKVTITTQLTADSQLLIAIKDNGSGIPDHIKDKIFQPFFTTKPTGQGTGLGLSLAYDIVKAHGGELKVETGEGVGSEFMIVLTV